MSTNYTLAVLAVLTVLAVLAGFVALAARWLDWPIVVEFVDGSIDWLGRIDCLMR